MMPLIYSCQDVLDVRLDARVEKMMQRGMLEEIVQFSNTIAALPPETQQPLLFGHSGHEKEEHQELSSDVSDDDDVDDDAPEPQSDKRDAGSGLTFCMSQINFSRGIFQSIGFKEFSPYVDKLSAQSASSELEPLLATCVHEVKASTRRYARRQIKWVFNRFVPGTSSYRLNVPLPHVYCRV